MDDNEIITMKLRRDEYDVIMLALTKMKRDTSSGIRYAVSENAFALEKQLRWQEDIIEGLIQKYKDC